MVSRFTSTMPWRWIPARAIAPLDFGRFALLRFTLRHAIWRRVYQDRATRLAVWFSVAAAFHLGMSLAFPLAWLIPGPLLLGVPHVAASIRYSLGPMLAPGRERRGALALAALFFCGIAAFRILHPVDERLSIFAAEAIVTALAYVAVTAASRHQRAWLAGLWVAPVFAAAWRFPLAAAGVLAFAHNGVGYLYWMRAAKTARELRTSIACTVVFIAVSVAIVLGAFDPVYRLITPQLAIPGLGLRFDQIGGLLAPWTSSQKVWYRATVAYAFGNGLHYFVWLKALGDQNLRLGIPSTFRQSWRHLLDDFGGPAVWLLGILSAAAILMYVFLPFAQARAIYFSAVGIHGFFEFLGLGFAAAVFVPTQGKWPALWQSKPRDIL